MSEWHQYFLYPSQYIIHASLKYFPDDFQVREVHNDNNNNNMIAEDCTDFQKKHIELDVIPNISKRREKILESKLIDENVIFKYLSPSILQIIAVRNTWIDSYISNNELKNDDNDIQVRISAEHEERRMIYEYLNSKYPYMNFTTLKHINDDTKENIYTMSVKFDTSYLSLLSSSYFSREDVKKLYIFKNLGSIVDTAKHGIVVGINLEKEQRTEVYQIITASNKQLDSRTIDVKTPSEHITTSTTHHNNRSNKHCVNITAKAMLIYWRSNQRNLKKRDRSGNVIESNLQLQPRGESSDEAITTALNLTTIPLQIVPGNDVYIWFTLVKRDIEQMDASKRIIQHLISSNNSYSTISISDISIAGIKDKRALTYQKMSLSIRNTGGKLPLQDKVNKIAQLLVSINSHQIFFPTPISENSTQQPSRGILCSNINFQNKPILLGSSHGNQFSIILRNVNIKCIQQSQLVSESSSSILNIIDILNKRMSNMNITGFPNLFGSQRFGIIYDNLQIYQQQASHKDVENNIPPIAISPSIGKLLIQENYKEAIQAIILGDLYIHRHIISKNNNDKLSINIDDSPVNDARRMYLAGGAISLVYSLFPPTSTRERILLKGLIRYGDTADPYKIIHLLPYAALTLYISAYQSYIWNQICFYRLSTYGIMPLEGDLVLPKKSNTITECMHESSMNNSNNNNCNNYVYMLSAFDIAACHTNEQIKTDIFQRIVLPLFGSKMQYPMNDVGRYYTHLLAAEQIPLYSSMNKNVFIDSTNTSIHHNNDDDNESVLVVVVEEEESLVVVGSDSVMLADDEQEQQQEVLPMSLNKCDGNNRIHTTTSTSILNNNVCNDNVLNTVVETKIHEQQQPKLQSLASSSSSSIPRQKSLYPRGTYRNIVQVPTCVSISPHSDSTIVEQRQDTEQQQSEISGHSTNNVQIEFRLPPGSFATAVLRELLCNPTML